jgi:hypothetical protein
VPSLPREYAAGQSCEVQPEFFSTRRRLFFVRSALAGPGTKMQNRSVTFRMFGFGMVPALLLVACMAVSAQTSGVNVTGTWTSKVSGDAGSADQTIVMKQDGGKITGTFKGPRQSGTIDGTVEGNNIKFHVTSRAGIDYVGTVDGDAMKGTLSARGKSGDWTAARAK